MKKPIQDYDLTTLSCFIMNFSDYGSNNKLFVDLLALHFSLHNYVHAAY